MTFQRRCTVYIAIRMDETACFIMPPPALGVTIF